MAFEPVVFIVDDDERAANRSVPWFAPWGSGPKRFPPPRSFWAATPAAAPAASSPTSA